MTVPMLDETTAAAQTLLADLTRLDVKLPPATTKALAVCDRAQAALAQLDRDGGTFVELVRSRAEGDTVDPDRLLAVLLGATLANRPRDRERLNREVADPVLAAIRDESDRIVAGLRGPFDAAAAALDKAAGTLGDVALDDLPAVTRLGGNAAQQWKDAVAAEKVIASVSACVVRLQKLRAFPVPGHQQFALVIADLDLDGWRKVAASANPWRVRQHGRLSLATGSEFTERVDRLERQWREHPESQGTRRAGQLAAATPVLVAR